MRSGSRVMSGGAPGILCLGASDPFGDWFI